MSKNNDRNKQIILDQLKKSPIIEVACQKTNISRATFYRWRKDNKTFAEQVDTAIEEGVNLINEVAESMLISAIQDKNMTGIMFWLRSHHNAYRAKVEVTTKNEEMVLTPEQEENIKRALSLASLTEGTVANEELIINERKRNEPESN